VGIILSMRSGFGFYFVFLLGFVAGIFFVAQTQKKASVQMQMPSFLIPFYLPMQQEAPDHWPGTSYLL
jgi:hypothetical protein